MALTGIAGRPGTGKSFKMVDMIPKMFADGCVVYTNLIVRGIKGKMVKPSFVGWFLWAVRLSFGNKIVPFSNYRYFASMRQLEEIDVGSVFVDEAHVYFDAYDRSNLPRSIRLKLTQQRKMGLDFTYTTQRITQVAKFFRFYNNEIIQCSHKDWSPVHLFIREHFYNMNREGEPVGSDTSEGSIPSKRRFKFITNWGLAKKYDTRTIITGEEEEHESNRNTTED